MPAERSHGGDRGVFVLSLDFELVWGSRDLADDPSALVRASHRTRAEVFQQLLTLLTDHDIVATWATVGHLFRDRCGRAPDPPPDHDWWPRPWFWGVPEGTEAEHPAWCGRSLVEALRDAGQEVGSHSYSHVIFGDPGCSRQTAEAELVRVVAEAEALGLALRSFVFPRNIPGHVDLLARHGFTCWRPQEPTWYHRHPVPRPLQRLAHLAEVATARRPPTVMPSRDAHGLWCIPASGTFLPLEGVRRVIPVRQRVRRCIRGIDEAVRNGQISHLYLHPVNGAANPRVYLDALAQVFSHAARLRDQGKLDILPMAALAERAEGATS